MAAVQTLKMIYVMEDDTTLTMSLKDPKQGLTVTQVNTFASSIIADEAIIREHSYPVRLKDAYINSVERIELAS